MTDFVYVDTAVGGVDRRNRVQRADAFRPGPATDCFRTVLLFGPDLAEYAAAHPNVNGRPSIAAYPGAAVAPAVFFDLDCKEDVSRAHADAVRLVDHLEQRWDVPGEALRVWYSGAKGFHVEIPATVFGGFAPATDIAERIRVLVRELVKDAGLTTLDWGVYTKTRLWRVPGSQHGDTKRFKVPLELAQLRAWPTEMVEGYAQKPRFEDWTPEDELLPRVHLAALWAGLNLPVNGKGEHVLTVQRVAEPIGESIRLHTRNTTLASLAGTMRRRGMTVEAMDAALQEMNAALCVPPLSKAEVRKIAESYGRYAPEDVPWELEPEALEPTERRQRFRTAREIVASTDEEITWYCRGLLARGAITEINGKIKESGKTTFVLNMLDHIRRGEPFLGLPTTPTGAVVLTEQNEASLRRALVRAGLSTADDVVILTWSKASDLSWPEVVATAAAEAKERGHGILIVDTLSQFAGIAGDSENNAGSALEAMKPLQLVAGEDELCVGLVRHERKGGGSVADAARGSSAFGGAVDIIIGLRRPVGGGSANERVLHSLSRYDETPDQLVFALDTDAGEYQVIGTETVSQRSRLREQVFDVLPFEPEEAMSEMAILIALGLDVAKYRNEVREVLKGITSRNLANRTGQGVRGNPFRYYRIGQQE